MAEKGAEKRNAERVQLTLPITYANLTNSDAVAYRYRESSIVDISSTGIGVLLDERVQRQDLIQVVLSLPISPYVITGLAQAVWIRELPDGKGYRVGLRFIQVPAELSELTIKELK